MITIAVTNQKGGVAKTTTALNLAVGLAKSGYRVLAVDLDPQAHFTMGLGVNSSDVPVERTVASLFRGGTLPELLLPTVEPNVRLLPANIDLAEEVENLASVVWREEKLARALPAVREDFDYVITDNGPNFGVLFANAIEAAQKILVPTKLSLFAVDGLESLLRTIRRVKRDQENYDLRILRTVVRGHGKEQQDKVWQLLTPLSDRILETQIRDTVGVERSQIPDEDGEAKAMVVVNQGASSGRAAQDYWNLVKEVLQLWPAR